MTDYEEEFPIEQTPKMKTFWCDLLVKAIYMMIMTSPFIVALFVYWIEKSLWISFLFGLFTLLVTGVLISKMRINGVPFKQREINYTTKEVIRWYVGKNICIQGDSSVS